jgi:hypothetical protein
MSTIGHAQPSVRAVHSAHTRPMDRADSEAAFAHVRACRPVRRSVEIHRRGSVGEEHGPTLADYENAGIPRKDVEVLAMLAGGPGGDPAARMTATRICPNPFQW